jgi:hypothetical protein
MASPPDIEQAAGSERKMTYGGIQQTTPDKAHGKETLLPQTAATGWSTLLKRKFHNLIWSNFGPERTQNDASLTDLEIGEGESWSVENVIAAVGPEVLPPLPTEDARISEKLEFLQKQVGGLWIVVVSMVVVIDILLFRALNQ